MHYFKSRFRNELKRSNEVKEIKPWYNCSIIMNVTIHPSALRLIICNYYNIIALYVKYKSQILAATPSNNLVIFL